MSSALDVAQATLAHADGDTEVLVVGESSGLARFASSEVHQPTLIDNRVVTARAVRGTRVGVARTNRLDDEGLRAVVTRAADAAASAAEDPTFPGLAPPMRTDGGAGYDEATATLGPDEQARLGTDAIAGSELPAYGFFTSGVTELAVASTTGLTAHERVTDATVVVVAADADRSGYAEASASRVGDLDASAVGREAAEKAMRTGGAVSLEPGPYAAVLEPYAFADLLQYFAYDSLGSVGLLERRGYFTDRVGERAFDERITMIDDAHDPRGLPKAFDFEGVPKQRVELVANGVIRGVVWDRATANRVGGNATTTGHCPSQDELHWGPLPRALAVSGGDAGSTGELVELIGDGLYITRLHYLGVVQPRNGVITGMTRDGTFRIRNGKVAEPLVNLRFTVAVPDLLREVPALTRDVKLVNGSHFYGDRYAFGALVPALATTHFNVTGAGSKPGI